MSLSDADVELIKANPGAAMITVGRDGMAKAARVAIGFIDGRLWSSGTKGRVRTARLQRDPRCTLYVQASGFNFLVLETLVTVVDSPEVPADSLRFFRSLQGKPTGPLTWFGGELTEVEFLQRMVDEGRVLYEFEVQRAYGLR